MQAAAPAAAVSAAINAGDTAWVLTSAALVMLMLPGLALFYGGLVRSKNSLNTLMMSIAPLGVVSVQWVLVGYALAFGTGNTLVHISAGTSALVCALMLGRRRDVGRAALVPHNVPFTLVGAGLLWFGWFGFNAGSALGANGLAGSAFLATNTAAASAMTAWML